MPDTALRVGRGEPKAIKDAFQASQATSTTSPPNWSDYAENVGERFASWLGEATGRWPTFWVQTSVLVEWAVSLCSPPCS
jgi:hypothetical protein